MYSQTFKIVYSVVIIIIVIIIIILSLVIWCQEKSKKQRPVDRNDLKVTSGKGLLVLGTNLLRNARLNKVRVTLILLSYKSVTRSGSR
jgi:cell division protein YceG involved in septum cleavage